MLRSAVFEMNPEDLDPDGIAGAELRAACREADVHLLRSEFRLVYGFPYDGYPPDRSGKELHSPTAKS